MENTNDPRSLVVLGFDEALAAQEMLTALTRMTTEGTLVLRDAVFVTKNDKGKIRVVETTDPSPGSAAWGGAFWGLLFGIVLAVPIVGLAIGAGSAALMAKLIDTGSDDKFIKTLRESIEPGKTYLAVLVSHINREKALEEMSRYSGLAQVISTNMTADAESALNEALSGGDVTQGVSEDDSTIAP